MPKGQVILPGGTATDKDVVPGPLAMEFRFIHYQQGWEPVVATDDSLLWVPVVKKGYLTAGLNNCTSKTPRGIERTVAGWIRDGGKPIPLDAPVLVTGDDGKLERRRGYLTTYDGKGGKHYADVWCNPIPIGADGCDWDSDYDTPGWDATLQLWAKEGLLNERLVSVDFYQLALIRNRVEQLSRNEDKLSDESRKTLANSRRLLALLGAAKEARRAPKARASLVGATQ